MLMSPNDLLRRIRFTLDASDEVMVEIFAKSGREISAAYVNSLLRKEHETGFAECGVEELTDFLDGLIASKRGQRQTISGQPAPARILAESNNVVLRKLRIAFDLQEEEMLRLLENGGFRMSKHELSALFRKQGHKHFRECGDQVLRYFLVGLTHRERPSLSTRETQELDPMD